MVAVGRTDADNVWHRTRRRRVVRERVRLISSGEAIFLRPRIESTLRAGKIGSDI